MNMKEHILRALREQLNHWEELLASKNEEQIIAPLLPSEWSIKDYIAHLYVWQQITIARMEAARADREPDYPQWIPGVDPDAEGYADLVNDWIYKNHHQLPWSQVHQDWRERYRRLIEISQEISEQDLLDWNRYPWIGFPLVNVLLATYNHHQEHIEKYFAWLEANSK